MMTGSGELRSSIRDAIDEDRTYQTDVHAATTLPEMMIDVDRHRTRIDAILGDMGMHMSSMMHCTGIGGMMYLRDGMASELDTHAATMHDELAVDPARTEADRHVGAMGTMLDDMGMMMDASHCSE